MIVLIFYKTRMRLLFFYGAGCGTNKMKKRLCQSFSRLFKKCNYFSRGGYLCCSLCNTKRGEKAIVAILGTG
jgi:Fe-S oxidoreductase